MLRVGRRPARRLLQQASQISTDSRWQHLPPVTLLEGVPQPTALAWLRRRLTGVPDSVLHRLFRQRLVAVHAQGGYAATGRASSLPQGTVLAVPAWVQREQPRKLLRRQDPGGRRCLCQLGHRRAACLQLTTAARLQARRQHWQPS